MPLTEAALVQLEAHARAGTLTRDDALSLVAEARRLRRKLLRRPRGIRVKFFQFLKPDGGPEDEWDLLIRQDEVRTLPAAGDQVCWRYSGGHVVETVSYHVDTGLVCVHFRESRVPADRIDELIEFYLDNGWELYEEEDGPDDDGLADDALPDPENN